MAGARSSLPQRSASDAPPVHRPGGRSAATPVRPPPTRNQSGPSKASHSATCTRNSYHLRYRFPVRPREGCHERRSGTDVRRRYDSWQETVYLLRSPANARSLMEAVTPDR
jgi:hypothetical protein